MAARKICELAAVAALLMPLQAGADMTACTAGEAERTVEVVYENPGEPLPCAVRYAKSDGDAQSLWRAQHEEGYCERQAVGLVQKLAAAGWACEVVTGDDSSATPATEPEADSEAVESAQAAPSAEAEAESPSESEIE